MENKKEVFIDPGEIQRVGSMIFQLFSDEQIEKPLALCALWATAKHLNAELLKQGIKVDLMPIVHE